MNIETWLLFFSAYLTITLSPGLNVLLVIKNAVKYGYKAVALTIFANLCCQLFIIISIAFGSGALLANSPILFFLLKVTGGVYLIYLGIRGLLKKESGKVGTIKKNKQLTPFSYFDVGKEAFIVSVSNPKTVIFLSAFLPQFLVENAPIEWQFMIMFLTISVIVTSVHFIYSYIARDVNKKWGSIKMKAIFSKITNCTFIIFGFSVLLSHRNT